MCNKPSKIAIRNNSDKIIIRVEAEEHFDGDFSNEYYPPEQIVVFYNVDSRIQKTSLDNIPRVDFWLLGNGNPITSFKNLSIYVISVVENGTDKVIQIKDKIFSTCQSCCFSDLCENNWQEKNGKYFHIGYINRSKSHLPLQMWSDWNSWLIQTRKENYFWYFINNIRCKFLLQDKMISIRFWILVMLNRPSEDSDGYIKFEQYSLFSK